MTKRNIVNQGPLSNSFSQFPTFKANHTPKLYDDPSRVRWPSHSHRETVQAWGTEFVAIWRQGSGPKQTQVNRLMEHPVPSCVGGEGRRTGTEAWLCRQVARRFWAPHTASLGVCLCIYSIRTLSYKDYFYDHDDLVKYPTDIFTWRIGK